MSQQALQSFREKVNGNAALEASIRSCLSEPGGALDHHAVAALGASNGFEFTAQVVQAALAGSAAAGTLDDELSDFELEMVAGGNPINCSDESKGQ